MRNGKYLGMLVVEQEISEKLIIEISEDTSYDDEPSWLKARALGQEREMVRAIDDDLLVISFWEKKLC